MTFYTPPAVLSALGLTTYEPAAGSGYFLINPPFTMTEPPPNTLCHTVYADRTIGLTITAWPDPRPVPRPKAQSGAALEAACALQRMALPWGHPSAVELRRLFREGVS